MEVSDQIIKVLDAVCSKFGIIVDWTNQNVAPYIQELFTKLTHYLICIATLQVGLSAAVISIGGVMLRNSCRVAKENKYDGVFAYFYRRDMVLTPIMIIFCFLIGGGLFVSSLVDLIKVLTFPELAVFQYIQTFM